MPLMFMWHYLLLGYFASRTVSNRATSLPSFLSPSSQDTALLSYVVQALYTSPSDPEVFQRLLLALLTVSKSHPQNLVQLLDRDRLKEFCTAKKTPPKEDTEGEAEGEGEKRESPSPDMEQDFLTKLNAVFWELIEQTPATPAVTSVATPGTARAACQTLATILPSLHPPCYHKCVCYATQLVIMTCILLSSPPGC